MEIKNKEQIVNLQAITNSKGKRIYICPRCRKKYTHNILDIKYCSKCGQHIAPHLYDVGDQQAEIQKNKLTIEDLKK